MKVPKLKGAVFESAVIERYRRREESVEEALIDMYLAGVSTRQVDDISQLLWGDRMPSQTLSDKLKKVYGEIEAWRTRPLEDEYPYVFMDGVWHKRSWGGHVENVSVLVAIGVNAEGHREVIGVAEGMKEDRDSWEQFVRSMIERGLKACAWWSATGAPDSSPRSARCCPRRDTSVHGAFHAQRALEDAADTPRMGVRRLKAYSPWNPGNPPWPRPNRSPRRWNPGGSRPPRTACARASARRRPTCWTSSRTGTAGASARTT